MATNAKTSRAGKVTSVNFTDENIILLDKVTGNRSVYLNYVIKYTAGLSAITVKETAEFFRDRAATYRRLSVGQEEYVRKEYETAAEEYEALLDIVTHGRGLPPKIDYDEFKKIDMDGCYLVCPQDWVEIRNFNQPEKCKYAIAIEFIYGSKYNLPHFVVFSEEEKLTDMEQAHILDLAAKISKEWNKARLMILPKEFEGILHDSPEYRQQPIPNFYPVPRLGTKQDYPYQAMIIDKRKEL